MHVSVRSSSATRPSRYVLNDLAHGSEIFRLAWNGWEEWRRLQLQLRAFFVRYASAAGGGRRDSLAGGESGLNLIFTASKGGYIHLRDVELPFSFDILTYNLSNELSKVCYVYLSSMSM